MPPTFHAVFGRYLAQLLQEHHLTQAQAAARVGVSQPTIAGWISGRRGITSAAVDDVLRAFEVPLGRALLRMAELVLTESGGP